MIFYLPVEAMMLTSCLFFVFPNNCCSLELKEQDMTVAIRQAGRNINSKLLKSM